MKNRRYKVRCLGTTVEIDGSCFGVAREIYGRQTYFAPTGFTIEQGDTVIDLGANVGVFSVLAARLGARVTAVEAQSEFVPIILQNLQRNGCTANVMHGLVGENSGVAAIPGALEAGSHYHERPPVLSLNQIMTTLETSRIDFLKIDIEGSEFDLFSKDLDWLSHTARIAMEVHTSFGDPHSIVQTLVDAGLQVHLCDTRLNSVSTLRGESGFLYAWRSAAL